MKERTPVVDISLAVPFAASAFGLRSLAGFAFSYGSPLVASVSLVAALAFGALYFRGSKTRKAALPPAEYPAFSFPTLVDIVPYVLYSLLSLADSMSLGSAAISPWPLLILVPAVLDGTGSGLSLFAAALPAACGVIEAAGAFSGAPRVQPLLPLAISMATAAFARAASRQRRAEFLRSVSENAERERDLSSKRDEEVEIAARIQRSLLLDTPAEACHGLSLEAITIASSSVDGDFYAFVPYSSSSMDILVGDVMGKGIPAALLGAALKGSFLRSSLRMLAEKPDSVPAPDELVTAVHDEVVRDLMQLESFATLEYARIDASRCLMYYVDCGHTPILHYDVTVGFCWSIKGTNLPLGFSEEGAYASRALPLAIGDRLIFYSDGITEAANAEGYLFGARRLADIAAANAAFDPKELVRRILNTAMFFTSNEWFGDDVTCVAVSLDDSPSEPRRASKDFSAQLSSLAPIRAFLERSLPDVDEAVTSRAVLVTCELVSNAVLHGEPADEGGGLDPVDPGKEEFENAHAPEPSLLGAVPDPHMLRVECVRSQDWVAIRLMYHGEAFPWYRMDTLSSVDALPSGGIGGMVIAQAADSVLYASAAGYGPGLRDLRLVCAFFEDRKEVRADR